MCPGVVLTPCCVGIWACCGVVWLAVLSEGSRGGVGASTVRLWRSPWRTALARREASPHSAGGVAL